MADSAELTGALAQVAVKEKKGKKKKKKLTAKEKAKVRDIYFKNNPIISRNI
jgi:hypothetical protein